MTTTPTAVALFRTLLPERVPADPICYDDRQLTAALLVGLGPLLHRAAHGAEGQFPAPFLLPAACAELAAKNTSNEQAEALREILDQASVLSDHVTLLKGIDARDYYPARHLRRMGDIDLLVEAADMSLMESALRGLGYEPEQLRMPESFYRDHHHSRPFVHAVTHVRVEIHRDLAAAGSPLGKVPAFEIASVKAHRRRSDCDGRPVYRLDPELALVYTIAHWCYDLRFPFVFNGLADTVLLLHRSDSEIDWNVIATWLDDQRVATAMYVMLTYLEKYGLAEMPPSFRAKLLTARKSVGPRGVRGLHALVDAGLSGRLWVRVDLLDAASAVWRAMTCSGRPAENLVRVPFSLLFPPGSPGRFSIGFQLRRIRSAFRSLRGRP